MDESIILEAPFDFCDSCTTCMEIIQYEKSQTQEAIYATPQKKCLYNSNMTYCANEEAFLKDANSFELFFRTKKLSDFRVSVLTFCESNSSYSNRPWMEIRIFAGDSVFPLNDCGNVNPMNHATLGELKSFHEQILRWLKSHEKLGYKLERFPHQLIDRQNSVWSSHEFIYAEQWQEDFFAFSYSLKYPVEYEENNYHGDFYISYEPSVYAPLKLYDSRKSRFDEYKLPYIIPLSHTTFKLTIKPTLSPANLKLN